MTLSAFAGMQPEVRDSPPTRFGLHVSLLKIIGISENAVFWRNKLGW